MPRKGKGKKGGRKGKKGRGGGGRADSLEDDADASMVAAGGFGRGREAATEDVKPGRFDDEEIDEDEAFNSDDEAKYGDLLPDYMKKGAAVGDSDDSDIDDEDDSDDEAGGGMLLSDILTANLRDEAASKGSASQASAAAQSLAAAAASRGRSNSGVSGDDSSESDVDSALESSGEEEAGVGDHAKLLSMVDDLAPATHTRVKRKGPARVQEVSEPLAEAEYNLAPDRGGLGGGLTLDALVGSLKDTTQYGGLKKKLSALDKGPAALQAPAGRVVEERATRQVQYQLTSKDVGKWQALVAANRRAPHLAFDHEQPHGPKLSTAALADKFKPATDLEKDVAKILNRSGLGNNKAVRTSEVDELQVNEVSVEEIRKRQGQLSKLKALLFYDELKRRRANKIKSKAFRRVRKRQNKRKEEKQREELRRLDPEAAAKMDEEEEMDIARARITLKHRNKGKWMKWAMKHGGTNDEGHKEALNAAHARPEELKRKMERVAGRAGDSSSSSDEEDGAGVKKYADRARALLDEDSDGGAGGDGEGGKPKGLFGLKFMQDVAKRRREEARKETAALVSELEALAGDGDGSMAGADGADEAGSGGGMVAGRRTFSGAQVGAGAASSKGASAHESAAEARAADEAMRAALRSGSGARGAGLQVAEVRQSAGGRHAVRVDGAIDVQGVPSTAAGNGDAAASAKPARTNGAANGGQSSDEEDANDGANPWMSRKSKRAKKSRGKTAARLPVADMLQSIETEATGAGAGAGAAGQEEWAQVEDGSWQAKGKKGKKGKGKKGGDAGAGGGAPVGALHGTQAAKDERQRKEEQLELVRRAFAGVGADEEFADEKAKLAEDAAPKAEPAAPAGWGSWTGAGVLPPPPPPRRKGKGKGKEDKPKLKVKKPKFHNVQHVMVNEKRDKKSVKYLADTIPYPFKTREQYERSLRNPLGPDWNTALTTEALVRPEITSKLGQLIEPVKYAKPLKRGGRVETSVSVRDTLATGPTSNTGKGKRKGDKNRKAGRGGGSSKKRRTKK